MGRDHELWLNEKYPNDMCNCRVIITPQYFLDEKDGDKTTNDFLNCTIFFAALPERKFNDADYLIDEIKIIALRTFDKFNLEQVKKYEPYNSPPYHPDKARYRLEFSISNGIETHVFFHSRIDETYYPGAIVVELSADILDELRGIKQ